MLSCRINSNHRDCRYHMLMHPGKESISDFINNRMGLLRATLNLRVFYHFRFDSPFSLATKLLLLLHLPHSRFRSGLDLDFLFDDFPPPFGASFSSSSSGTLSPNL